VRQTTPSPDAAFTSRTRRYRPSHGGCLLSREPISPSATSFAAPRRLGVGTRAVGTTPPETRMASAGRTATAGLMSTTDMQRTGDAAQCETTHTFPFCPDGCSSSTTSRSTTSNYAPNTARSSAPPDELNFERWRSRRTRDLQPQGRQLPIKPIGEENEHPATRPATGSDHLVDLLSMIEGNGLRGRTRWSSSRTTSSADSGITSRRPAGQRRRPHDVGSGHPDPPSSSAPHLNGQFVVDRTSTTRLDHRHDRASLYDLAPLGRACGGERTCRRSSTPEAQVISPA